MRRPATVLAIGVSVLLTAACGESTHVAVAPPRALTATVSGLALTYPATFHIRRFSTCSREVTGDTSGGCVHGAVVASYPVWTQAELRARGAWFQRKTGVALELERRPTDPAPSDVRLGDRSLALWPFAPVDDNNGPIDPGPMPVRQYWARLQIDGRSYAALASVGSDATPAERQALAGLIRSVHAVEVTPHEALPLPPRQVVHVLCSGTPDNPRMPNNTPEVAGGNTCALISGSTCRVFTQEPGSPASAIRERHFRLAAFVCRYTRRFLVLHPRGYEAEPQPSGRWLS